MQEKVAVGTSDRDSLRAAAGAGSPRWLASARGARARARRMHRGARAAYNRSRLLLELSESFAAATSVRDVAERLAAVGAALGARSPALPLLAVGGTRRDSP